MKMGAIASRKDGWGVATPFQPRLRLRLGPPPARDPMVLTVNLANFLLCPHSQRAYCKIGNVVGLFFFCCITTLTVSTFHGASLALFGHFWDRELTHFSMSARC